MVKINKNYGNNVFINCPFDEHYKPLFNAIIFTIHDCGFIPRSTLEEEDSSEYQISKIYKIVLDCKYGIHDISRTELSKGNKLPRFNMPLELGIFLAAKRFGEGKQKKKKCLILDKEPHRYQKFISDIAGQDIKDHGNDVKEVIKRVRNWLRNSSSRVTIPGPVAIWTRYQTFLEELPELCKEARWDMDELIFIDYSLLIEEWLIVQS